MIPFINSKLDFNEIEFHINIYIELDFPGFKFHINVYTELDFSAFEFLVAFLILNSRLPGAIMVLFFIEFDFSELKLHVELDFLKLNFQNNGILKNIL